MFTLKTEEDVFLASPATCTQKARFYFSCQCGAVGIETFETGEMLPHEYKEVVSEEFIKSPATCTKKAEYFKSCVCGLMDTATFEAGDYLAHEYTREVVSEEYLKSPATCTQKAKYYKLCECGAVGTEIFEAGEMLPHEFLEVVSDEFIKSPATCTKRAEYFKSCVCGLMDTATFEAGDYLAHEYTGEVVSEEFIKSPATCTQKAKFYLSCQCGEIGTETFEYGDVLPHEYKEVVSDEFIKSPATCTKRAEYFKSCVCGLMDTATFEAGELLPHTFEQSVVSDAYLVTPATCTNRATYYKSCVCGLKGTTTFEIGDLLAHDYHSEITKNATCTEKGIITYTCSCGATYTEDIPITNKHNYVNNVCTVCGKTNDCNHQEKTPKSTYLGDSCCNSYIYYLECNCGLENEFVAEINKMVCPISSCSYEMNGGQIILICNVCSTKYVVESVKPENSCDTFAKQMLSIYHNDILKFKATAYEPFPEHDYTLTKYNESDIGICNCEIRHYECETCSFSVTEALTPCLMGQEYLEFVEMLTTDPDISSFNNGLVDENGNKYREFINECETCHGILKATFKLYSFENCNHIVDFSIVISKDGEVYVEQTMFIQIAAHNMETTFNLTGDTCYQGYQIVNRCTDCNYQTTNSGTGHDILFNDPTMHEEIDIDFSPYGCNTKLTYKKCNICNLCELISEPTCALEYISVENVIENNLEKTVVSLTCATCNIDFVIKQYLKLVDCIVFYCNDYIIKKDEQLIGEVTTYAYYSESHDMVISYQFLGTTCKDGLTIINACSRCDYKEQNTIFTHDYVMENKYYGLCNHEYQVYKCKACNEEELYVTYVHTFDISGTDGDYTVYECNVEGCNASYLEREQIVTNDENCDVLSIRSFIVKDNDVEIYQGSNTHKYSSHNYTYSYELVNPYSCELGVKENATCIKCHDTYSKDCHEHKYQCLFDVKNVDGACNNHHFSFSLCPCNKHQYHYDVDSTSFITTLQTILNGNQEQYTCNTCNIVITCKTTTTGDCVKDVIHEITITKDGNVIFNQTITKQENNHNYEAVSIQDGKFIVKCQNCNETNTKNVMAFVGSREFTCDETGLYLIRNLSGGLDMFLYENNNYICNFIDETLYLLTSGNTYRVEAYGSATLAFSYELASNVGCNHSLTARYHQLADGCTSCSESVYKTVYCTECGMMEQCIIISDEYHTLIEYKIPTNGACNEYFTYSECLCGYSNISFSSHCATNEEWSNHMIDGKDVVIVTSTCSTCSFKIVKTIMDINVGEQTKTQHTYKLYVGDELICQLIRIYN